MCMFLSNASPTSAQKSATHFIYDSPIAGAKETNCFNWIQSANLGEKQTIWLQFDQSYQSSLLGSVE